MHAVLLSGHGGMEKLEYRSDVEAPILKDDEVLINVKAAQEDFLRKKYSGKLVLIPTNDNI